MKYELELQSMGGERAKKILLEKETESAEVLS